MNSVFEITLNMPLNAVECSQYDGHWCGWCGKDNGGGKFCYECGKREVEDLDECGNDVFDYLVNSIGEKPVKNTQKNVMHVFYLGEQPKYKFVRFSLTNDVYKFDDFLHNEDDAELLGKWDSVKQKVDFYDDDYKYYFYDDSDSDDE